MFDNAYRKTAQHQDVVNRQLTAAFDSLEKTANSWFDNTSASVTKRISQLSAAASLCYRVASYSDDEDAAELRVVAESFVDQAKELERIKPDLHEASYEEATGLNPKFTSALADETYTAATRKTDWGLFLAIEPREFVANNSYAIDNADEMRIRAFNFMDDATSGHGISRSAKQTLSAEFLSKVELCRRNEHAKTPTKKQAAKTENFSDSSLFF